MFNAAVKHQVDVGDIARWFDTISVCLSKGLGAPVGFGAVRQCRSITKARRWRKVLGGGMRQAGLLAAAGIYALQNNVDASRRITNMRGRSQALFQQIGGVSAGYGSSQTNMVYLTVEPTLADPLRQFLKQRGILIGGGNPIRLVTHLDVSRRRHRRS